MENKTTLATRVATHYDLCRDVNASWREFTNDLATLNLLGYLDEDNYEFVVDLLLDTEEFEDEDAEELSAAVGEYLAPLKTVPEWVCAADLDMVERETGCEPEEVAGWAEEVGVPAEEVATYLAER